MDIWYCIVESVQFDNGSMWGYRLLKAIKANTQDRQGMEKCYAECSAMQAYNYRAQSTVFTRSADETMFTQEEKVV